MNIRKLYRYYMLFIGVIGQSVFYAQAYKIFTTHDATSVSLLGFSIGLISVFSWFLYGVMLKDFPLILSNFIATIGAITTVIGILLYS